MNRLEVLCCSSLPGPGKGPARRTRGFTLIELMIVVAIAALLAAVALPAYFDSVRKGRRADAFGAVGQVQQAQERWRANNAAYSTDVSANALRLTAGATTISSYTLPSGYYTITVSGASATGYTVTAAAAGSQASDTNCKFMQVQMAGGNLTYSSGSTSALGNSSAVDQQCWRR